MGNSPDAYEFDKTNPHQNLNDFLATVRKLADEGRMDKINEIISGCANNAAADLAKGVLESREDP